MRTVRDEAVEGSQLHAFYLGSAVRVIDALILPVLVTLVPDSAVKLVPREGSISRNYDFLQLLLAEGAAFVAHEQSNAQAALCADEGVPARTQCNVLNLIVTQNASVFAGSLDVLLADATVDSRPS